MSLRNRLWLSLSLLVVLAIAGVWVAFFLATQGMLKEQLRVKNVDNATVLALSLSQFADAPVAAELYLSAQFDLGHYQNIELRLADGSVLFARRADPGVVAAPVWFRELLEIDAPAGEAQVQQGWRQVGTLSLQSHNGFAYEALWQATRQALVWMLVVCLFAIFAAALGLTRTLRPLNGVVHQAQNVAQRRFLQLPLPHILEFHQLVTAMNTMSQRVKEMLNQDAQRIDALRREVEIDTVTGLLEREVFQERLQSFLHDYPAGHLVVLGLDELQELNQEHGHVEVDRVLGRLGAALNVQGRESAGGWRWIGGRLGGSEFALFFEKLHAPDLVAQSVLDLAADLGREAGMELPLFATRVEVHGAPPVSAVLQAMGRGLSDAQTRGTVVSTTMSEGVAAVSIDNRDAVKAALDTGQVRLKCYPIQRSDGPSDYCDAYMELALEGQWQSAGQVLPLIGRLGLNGKLDCQIVDAAVSKTRQDGVRMSVQLSMDVVTEADIQDQVMAILLANPEAAARLYLEVPEFGVRHHLQAFRLWCLRLQDVVGGVGIRHAGYAPEVLGELADLGLAHVKLDSALMLSLHDPHTVAVIGGLCAMAHSMGLQVTATGVSDGAVAERLFQLGVDGLTGPAC